MRPLYAATDVEHLSVEHQSTNFNIDGLSSNAETIERRKLEVRKTTRRRKKRSRTYVCMISQPRR